MYTRTLAAAIAAAAFVGCGNPAGPRPDPAGPLAPSAIPNASTAAPNVSTGTIPADGRTSQAAFRDVMVTMQDACDPETFNEAIGEGTCTRNGGVTFDLFIAQLTRLGLIGSWRFAPGVVNARAGDRFVAVNRGGEAHTFTEVEEFGGGIVPDLNELAGVPTVAPECMALGPGDFVAPGGTIEEDIEEAGHEKYQCCIHPWMRLEANVSQPH